MQAAPIISIVKLDLLEKFKPTALAAYISYYKEFSTKGSAVYDGVRAVLDDLQNADIKMGVCSNKVFEMVSLILESFDLAKYVCAVTGGIMSPLINRMAGIFWKHLN